MKQRHFFPLLYLDDSMEQGIGELKTILEPFGISVSINTTSPQSGKTFNTLEIEYSTEVIHRKATRNAGRKKNFRVNPERLTIGKVKELLESQSAEEVAKRLKMSRATFFRHYKKQRELGSDDQIFF